MGSPFQIALALIGIGFVLAFLFYTIRQSAEPWGMVVKWAVTFITLAILFGPVGSLVAAGGYGGAFIGIPLAGVCGLVLAVTWHQTVAGLVANFFGSLYDGGSTPADPKPVYSIARARQKQGLYAEAVALVREQLNLFPNDVEGHMFLAEIQAENQKDLVSAEQTIRHFCAQHGHAPKNVVFALYSMADWHLSITQDRDSARACFEKIIELFPDTEFSLGAAQRIAHLASPEMLVRGLAPEAKPLKKGESRVGLLKSTEELKPAEEDPGQVATEYVRHLESHPLDSEVREKLAVLYADHYHRLDLAVDQLEQMILIPNQAGKNIVRWLNLMADLQVRGGADLETVQGTLQRIIDRGPNLAAADLARNRLNLLKLEFKANEKNESVKMGAYEQNIGLASSRRLGPDGKRPSAS